MSLRPRIDQFRQQDLFRPHPVAPTWRGVQPSWTTCHEAAPPGLVGSELATAHSFVGANPPRGPAQGSSRAHSRPMANLLSRT